MFHFQTLDVYRCAAALLPIGYDLAALGDGEMASQLRRAALSISHPQDDVSVFLRGIRTSFPTDQRCLVALYFLDAFAETLHAEGYSLETCCRYVRTAADLGAWAAKRSIAIAELDPPRPAPYRGASGSATTAGMTTSTAVVGDHWQDVIHQVRRTGRHPLAIA